MSTQSPTPAPGAKRILVIDDNPAIHADFKKILGAQEKSNKALVDAKAAFFGKAAAPVVETPYEIESASQGKEALEMVKKSLADGRPYALAFVDVRMPPGWDGVETIARMWEADPDLQCVICTAFADYSWDEMIAKLGRSDRLLILKKPFDPIEACQIASTMTEKWSTTRRERARLDEVKQAEQEARAYSASLITTNRALEAARARSEAALRAKSEQMASTSQGIRAPLLAILHHARDLRAAAEAPELAEHSREILEKGEAVLGLLSNLFDLACLDTNRMTLARCPTSPLGVVDDVLSSFEAAAKAKGLELGRACDGPVPSEIQTDPVRLRQILAHLVENAIRYTSAGSVQVALSLDAASDHEPVLSIAVADTGAGIAPELDGRLFEAFGGSGGTGLGLALSKRLAQALGGDIAVESERGSGSTFTLTLRTGDLSGASMHEEPRAPIPSEKAAHAPEHAALPDLSGMRVLLVEDVVATQKLFKSFLEHAGATVDVASDGREGVDRVLEADRSGKPFDVVLMDVQMPVLDGHAATRELRRAGYRRPIVAVTAHAMTGDRERCLEAGCDDYASKPLGRRMLLDLCRQRAAKSASPASSD